MTALVAINYSAPVSSVAGTITAGQCLVSSGTAGFVVASAANRTTYGRADGIAFTTGDQKSPVVMILIGPVPASVTGLGTGLAGPIRVSSAGVLERVATPNGSDEVVGHCETDGRAHVAFGVLTHRVYVDSGGGGSFTAGGDLSGDETSQTVESIQGIAISGTPAAGAVLRATAADAAAWGTVNLADSDAVTGQLPSANIAGTLSSKTLSGCTIDADSNTVTNIENADIKAGAAIALSKIVNPTGTGLVKTSGGAIAAAAALLVNADVDASAAIALSKIVNPTGTGLVKTSGGAIAAASALLVNADVDGSAAIAVSKLAAGTNTHVLETTGGSPAWVATTGSGSVARATDPAIANTSINNTTSGGTINDCTLSGTAGFVRRLRFTDATGPTVTGFSASGVADGTILRVTAAGGTVAVNHEDAGSAAANRVVLQGGIAINIAAGVWTEFMYDATSSRWRHSGATAI